MKRIVIAPDSFKGTLSSTEFCDIAEKVINRILPDAEVCKIPIADGGEGTADTFLYALGGKRIYANTEDPLGRKINVPYALLPDGKTAVIETAAASGITLVEDRKDPLAASSYGTGLLIKDALSKGCRKIILGLGGSATTDGGSGIAEALGAAFYDTRSRKLRACGAVLSEIAEIDLTGLDPALAECEFIVACDVDNPLFGPNGAAYVFAPQKGADKAACDILDKGLRNYAEKLFSVTGKAAAQMAGAGAAGGILVSILSLCSCQVTSGIELMLDVTGFDRLLCGADLVITGEGKFDRQSLNGKVPIGIAAHTKAAGVPLAVLAGNTAEYGQEVYETGIVAVFNILNANLPFEELKKTAAADLEKTLENIFRFYCAFK